MKKHLMQDCLASRCDAAGVSDLELPQHMILDASVNEVYLWHGCQDVAAMEIIQSGFDERLANWKALYGTGNYFASEVCKSLQYARARGCNNTRTWGLCGKQICQCRPRHMHGLVKRRLLLCRVLLGDPYFASGPLLGHCRPPGNGDSIVVDPKSVHKRKQAHHEYVVWNHQGAQAYPEFIVDVEINVS